MRNEIEKVSDAKNGSVLVRVGTSNPFYVRLYEVHAAENHGRLPVAGQHLGDWIRHDRGEFTRD